MQMTLPSFTNWHVSLSTQDNLTFMNSLKRKTLKRRFLSIIVYLLSSTVLSIQTQFVQANSDYYNLPDLGSSAKNILPSKLARKVGAAYIRQARSQMEFVDDPLLLNYLNTLGNKLATVATANYPEHQDFTFYLVNDPSINAFAIPGGHIVIHTGLILNSKNEQHLAATLAHEIAHITQNHTARSLEKSRYNSAISIASILLAAASRSTEAAQAAIIASQGGLLQQQLAYTRGFEREADNSAVRILYQAGYDPNALTDFLKILNKKQSLSGSKPPAFLLTHPLTNERISETNQRARAYPVPAIDPESEFAFENFKAVIEVEFHAKPATIIKRHTIKKDTLTASDHLQLGLALIKKNQFSKAQSHLNSALQQYPDNLFFQIAMTDLAVAQQDYQLANQQFERIKNNDPENYPLIAAYHANALIISRQNEKALVVLKQIADNNPNEPLIHILLARTYGELELLSNSYQERAQYHYLRGNYAFAIKQLDNALPYTDNPYQKRKILSKKESFRNEMLATEAALKKL